MNKFFEIKMSSILKITPQIEELSGKVVKIECTEPGCESEFNNKQNFKFHLKSHHRKKDIFLTRTAAGSVKQFYCPISDCCYHSENESKKFFTCLKYLKQHFVKVHAEKSHKCKKCDQAFSTVSILKSHEQICGQGLQCAECGWSYNSKEALYTHGKRKGHKIYERSEKADDGEPAKKKNRTVLPKPETKSTNTQVSYRRSTKSTQTSIAKKERIDSNTQTCKREPNISFPKSSFGTQTNPQSWVDDEIENENSNNNLINNSSQTTNNLNNMGYFEDSVSLCFPPTKDPFDATLCNIETQTEAQDTTPFNLDQLDQFYNNMHTQTCDDFIVELSLSDIQTQTNWDYNDTETQTSFSQCLLPISSQQTQTGSMEFLCSIGNDDQMNGRHSIHTQT